MDMAFSAKLVQNLAPDHRSISGSLQRNTPHAGRLSHDGVLVQANCVYVISANRNIGIFIVVTLAIT